MSKLRITPLSGLLLGAFALFAASATSSAGQQVPPVEGCTPGYWKSHLERWDGANADDFTTSIRHTDLFNASFSVLAAESMLADTFSLGEACELLGGGLMSLNRHAAAAMPSADAPAVNYPYTVAEVISMYRDAIGVDPGPLEILTARDLFQAANESNCPLNNTPPIVPFCYADLLDCPCGNNSPLGGCVNETGLPGIMTVTGTTSYVADDFALHVSQLPPNQFTLFFAGRASVRMPFGDGILCLDPTTKLLRINPPQMTDGTGSASRGPGLLSLLVADYGSFYADFQPGDTWYFQNFYRDPDGNCSSGFNLTNAAALTFLP